VCLLYLLLRILLHHTRDARREHVFTRQTNPIHFNHVYKRHDFVIHMSRCNGPYPHVAEALIVIFTNAVARNGKHKSTLHLERPCTAHSHHQWTQFIEHGDSVALISWCADKIRYWHTRKYMKNIRYWHTRKYVKKCHYWKTRKYLKLQAQAPLYGIPDSLSFKIMSPDGQTDWTLAAWHIHFETNSTLEFTEDIMDRMEAALAT